MGAGAYRPSPSRPERSPRELPVLSILLEWNSSRARRIQVPASIQNNSGPP
jgi:hypothetical protein